MRRLLRRGSFTSKDDLKQQILDEVAYFNRTLASPFKWKFEGYPDLAWTGQLLLPACTREASAWL